MIRSKKKEAILSWTYQDYLECNIDAPDRVVENSSKTEGEMMSDDEIESWFLDSLKTMEVMKEEDLAAFERIHRGFILDLEYLFKLGRIEEDILDYARDIRNFDFDKEN